MEYRNDYTDLPQDLDGKVEAVVTACERLIEVSQGYRADRSSDALLSRLRAALRDGHMVMGRLQIHIGAGS